MIDIIKSDQQVLALRLQGDISAADIAQVRKAMEQKLAAHPAIGVAMDFSGFSDATGEAIREDLRFEMGLLSEIARLEPAGSAHDQARRQTGGRQHCNRP